MLGACTSGSQEQVTGGQSGAYLVPGGIHKIKHVIIVMQENRSFDSYFGTYPGADGIPMRNGVPTVCVPDPAGGCTRPYHDTADVNGGGPHGTSNAVPDVKGYHTGAEIPNYWAYAQNFVLQDHMFEPVKSWSLPEHLYMVSAWSAKCRNRSPMSCVNNIVGPYGVAQFDKAVRQEMATGKTSI